MSFLIIIMNMILSGILNWIEAIALVLTIVVLCYASFMFFRMRTIIYFSKEIKSNILSLKLIMAERITLTQKLAKILQENEIQSEIIEQINVDYANLKDTSISELYKKLDKAFRQMYRSAILSERLAKCESFQIIKTYSDENAAMYRKVVEEYNSNVGGYNYWVKFIIGRRLVKAMKFTKKQSIY